MSPHQRKEEDYNRNWEAEIAKFDAECAADEKEFREHSLVFGGNGTPLTEEESMVFDMVLQGLPLCEVAGQCGVEEDMIAGLVEIIRAKLSLPE